MKREFVTDFMVEKLNDLIDAEALDWQEDLDIPTGDLPPLLTYKLSEAVEHLLDVFNECITWQAENAQEVE